MLRAIAFSKRFEPAQACADVEAALQAARERQLQELSQETGIEVQVLRTFAGISDPANKHLFTAEAAREAFAKLQRKP